MLLMYTSLNTKFMINSVFNININFNKSKGSYLFDNNSNKSFLDVFSMFSSLPLGYNHEIFDESFDIKVKAVSHLRMSNNLFESNELIDFEKKFNSISFHKYLHLCATGALAVESALKCAFEIKKDPEAIVVGLKNSYHGINSWGFITDSLISSVSQRVINFPKNNWQNIPIEKINTFISNNINRIAAVIIEPIQCTAGDIYIDIDRLKDIELICKNNNICFIIDEIQTGFGVTGDYWYSKEIGLEPDIIVFGKKSQICGIMVNEDYSEAILSKYRKLEVTFDGELIDAIRCSYIIDAIEKHLLLENVKVKSKILMNELSNLFINYRSTGHLVAFDFLDNNIRDKFVKKCYSNFLLVNPTGDNSVRLRPNLAFSDNDLDELVDKIKRSLN
jgi:L-lysine 6-transaminase